MVETMIHARPRSAALSILAIAQTIAQTIALPIALSGCGGHEAAPAPSSPSPEARSASDAAEMTPPPWLVSPASLAAHEDAPAAGASAPVPSASRDPAVVARAWADAVEQRDWALVRAFWGEGGTRSGLSQKAFAARWGQLVQPRVTLEAGQQEGAAGSLYDTVPVTIIDGAHHYRGQIVLRRANDGLGASAEQMRWHIESTTFPF